MSLKNLIKEKYNLIKSSYFQFYKPDMEMCAGKKWMFPEKRLYFYKLK